MPRQSLDMPHSCSQGHKEMGGFLPVSVPELLSFLSLGQRERDSLEALPTASTLLGFVLPLSPGRTVNGETNRKQETWGWSLHPLCFGFPPPSAS